jgi:hypothetical protein
MSSDLAKLIAADKYFIGYICHALGDLDNTINTVRV